MVGTKLARVRTNSGARASFGVPPREHGVLGAGPAASAHSSHLLFLVGGSLSPDQWPMVYSSRAAHEASLAISNRCVSSQWRCRCQPTPRPSRFKWFAIATCGCGTHTVQWLRLTQWRPTTTHAPVCHVTEGEICSAHLATKNYNLRFLHARARLPRCPWWFTGVARFLLFSLSLSLYPPQCAQCAVRSAQCD
jgi:hypothetical protein